MLISINIAWNMNTVAKNDTKLNKSKYRVIIKYSLQLILYIPHAQGNITFYIVLH